MITLSPVGLASAPVANRLAVLATFRERLCRPFCVDSSIQPQVTVSYTTGTPVLNGTTVFVPVIAVMTVVVPGCGCRAVSQLFTERFTVAFQGQTVTPSSVTITSVGRRQGGTDVQCGKAHTYTLNDSLAIVIA